MASNKLAWLRNMGGPQMAEPCVRLGLFQAGSTQAIKKGEILELSSGNWIPLASDKSMSGTIAVANEEIKAGDLAGYYEILVPRPGDVFEFALAASSAVAEKAPLYWSSSQALSVTAGTNIVGYSVGQEHFPPKQNHASDGGTSDSGTSLRSTAYVRMVFKASISYFAALQP